MRILLIAPEPFFERPVGIRLEELTVIRDRAGTLDQAQPSHEIAGIAILERRFRGQRRLAHGLRLPRLAVVAADLHVADRLAEAGAASMADGQLRDLVVEIHEALDDDLAGAGAPAFLGTGPGNVDVGRYPDSALALAG